MEKKFYSKAKRQILAYMVGVAGIGITIYKFVVDANFKSLVNLLEVLNKDKKDFEAMHSKLQVLMDTL